MSLVVAYVVKPDGSLGESSVSRARVHNRAKLAYNAVAAWLDGPGPLPEPAARVPGMDAQLRTQDEVAARLRRLRHERGALDLQSLESRPVFSGDTVVGLQADQPNRAKWLIEDFMIAANGVVARFLAGQARPSLRRVVRSPERWAKIVDKAAEYGESLPATPSAIALEAFLTRRRAADPLRFPDLSLVIVKLMGAGEYVVERPGEAPIGHFGLAVTDYAHATAPNRRFPDLVTHRLLKAALAGAPSPYGVDELDVLANHCTVQEGAAAKVERQVRKSAAALLLEAAGGRELRRRDHRRRRQGHLGARLRTAGRGPGRARRPRPARGRQGARSPALHRFRARLHRLRAHRPGLGPSFRCKEAFDMAEKIVRLGIRRHRDFILYVEPASYFDDVTKFCARLGRLGFDVVEPQTEGAFVRIYAVRNAKKVDPALVLPFRGHG